MKKINIALLGGGFSNEREVSIKTTEQIAKALPKNKYNVFQIEIKKNRKWFLKNTKKIIEIEKFLSAKKIDLAFVALHGKFGEDGIIQALLEYYQIPYTGSGVLASALGMNKFKCLELVEKYKIKVPKSFCVNKNKKLSEIKAKIKKQIGYPCVIKPNESGSSIGVSIIKKEKELPKALKKAFLEDDYVLVEEFIKGREITCGVLGNTGKTEILPLPPVEIISHDSTFFDYQAKYLSKATEEICPAKLNKRLTFKVQNFAQKAHEIIGCKGLTRSDFILRDKDNEFYFLEINTIPGQTEASLCPKEAKALKISFSKFIEKQIELALKK